jgi:hypothetical protein
VSKRTSLTPGEKNVVSPPLVLPEKIYLPPFAHKAGPHEKFVKVTDKTCRGFEYVKNNFPNVSDRKIKEGIYIYIYIYRTPDQATDARHTVQYRPE